MSQINYEMYRERNDQIVSMWNDNQTGTAIAYRFDIDVWAVHQVIYRRRRAGQSVRWGVVGHNRERDKRIIELVEAGKRNAQIARIMGLSPNSVASVVRRHYAALGIKRPEPRRGE